VEGRGNIYPVVLAGGSGTRLWPMSREACPKQFLPLFDDMTPFQATLARLPDDVQPITIVTHIDHRYIVRDQARASGRKIRSIYLEPAGRSTAPALALVAHELMKEDPEALLLALPSDHDIPDRAEFGEAIARGARAAALEHLVVFGVEPRWPETGYGYIERADDLAQAPGCHRVASFVEKPELEIATRLASSGRHYWNSGIFLFSARTYLDELERLDPELYAACIATSDASTGDNGCRRIDEAAFEKCRAVSIDHAIMEQTHLAAVVPARFRWSDIGSWDALWDRGGKDDEGNELHGDVQVHDSSNCYIRSNHRMVVGIGLEDVVVVETPDALLVAKRGETQRVREAVDQLRSRGRSEHRTHRLVHRPWGCYEDIDSGDRFRVKRISVNPGAKLSLQWHHHRAEHWIVVSGTAKVTRGEETTLLSENQSLYIAIGEIHRLENPGKVPLQLIEVQTGCYLGEDDIVRVEDVYERVESVK